MTFVYDDRFFRRLIAAQHFKPTGSLTTGVYKRPNQSGSVIDGIRRASVDLEHPQNPYDAVCARYRAIDTNCGVGGIRYSGVLAAGADAERDPTAENAYHCNVMFNDTAEDQDVAKKLIDQTAILVMPPSLVAT